MIVQENPMAADLLIHEANDFLQGLYPREAGLHVSDIIKCRRASWFRAQGYQMGAHSTQTLLLFLMGQGHHSLLEAARAETKLEAFFDGIRVTGSVDNMETDDQGPYPAEYKTTRASAGKMKVPSEQYVLQAASYAVMEDTNHARIYVIFLLGDYKGAKLPQIKAWDVYFSVQELRLWRGEMARRAVMIAGDTLPSLDEHATWECKYCPYAQDKGGPCEGGEGKEHQWFPTEVAGLDDLLRGD